MQSYEHEVPPNEGFPVTVSVNWASTSVNDEALDPYDVSFESWSEPAQDGKQLLLAVESKKRDNLALGETLVQIGLLGRAKCSMSGLLKLPTKTSAIRFWS